MLNLKNRFERLFYLETKSATRPEWKSFFFAWGKGGKKKIGNGGRNLSPKKKSQSKDWDFII